jgi:RNA-directed DNA polymerase
VIDLDIRAFFDSVDHELVLRAVRRHTDERWILLYVERWLKAPLQQEDGTLVQRDRGTPQGSSISPLLANLFLHYAFDVWMRKQFPDLQFERYCDDGVVHCKSEQQAQFVRDAIARRLAQCGLELHPDKTRIVYCKDADRRATYANERFDFLGYTFRSRLSKGKAGKFFVNFLPAVSDGAIKSMSRELRSWRINCRSDKSLGDLAHMFNKVVQGWINYYGRFYQSMLYPLFRRINGPNGNTNGCTAMTDGRGGGWCALRNARRSCLRTGGWACGPMAGQWELCELRGSCTVLREPRGETPLGHSPCGSVPGSGRRRAVSA